MKKFASFTFIFLTSIITNSFSLFADVKLPALFTDNMVLQQKTDVAIWGEADKNTELKITTSWNKKSYTTKVGTDGNWKLKIATPKAGGPYQISITEGKTIILKDVLIGDVWLCSGQSNMEMPMKGFRNQPISGSAEAIALSSNPQIRLLGTLRT